MAQSILVKPCSSSLSSAEDMGSSKVNPEIELNEAVVPDGTGDSGVKNGSPAIAQKPAQVYEFEWQETVWHSGMLIFFKFESLDCIWDTVVNALGLAINIGLQILFLLIIQTCILSEPFTSSTLTQMMEWRMASHAASHVSDSRNLVQRLCDQTLWSFEQGQFDTIHTYLSHDNAFNGTTLAVVCVLLWILKICAEYRNTVNQIITIFSLPTISGKEDCTSVSVDDDGNVTAIEIIGIRSSQRVCLMVFLCVPRLIVLFWLGGVGIVYLAQTVNLSDIVLNAMALSFVIDIDEQIYEVLMPDSIHGKMKNLQPISVGRRPKAVGCIFELSRWTILIAAFVVGIVVVLNHESAISAAHEILCGGNVAFAFEQDTTDPSSTISIMDMNGKFLDEQQCSAYYASTYPSVTEILPPDMTQSNGTLTKQLNLGRLAKVSYAFSNCETCNIPEMKAVLEEGWGFSGSPVDLPPCPLFDESQGTEQCQGDGSMGPPACLQSLSATSCEGPPPGVVHKMVCSMSPTAIEVWESLGVEVHGPGPNPPPERLLKSADAKNEDAAAKPQRLLKSVGAEPEDAAQKHAPVGGPETAHDAGTPQRLLELVDAKQEYAAAKGAPVRGSETADDVGMSAAGLAETLALMKAEMAALRSQVAEIPALRRQLEELRQQNRHP
eukprot:gnl/MRDRNA2_/MRDRNA2_30388_c0_seq1.p1 gnl/MRDRNA2_/MRDRNA2_30388_c0~~gnl/MRDRNA2_/MRDRNA2_30388_c0_seq1.p1  ORF type:complete len:672 (-),score=112.68 gnl/MRDRNA2_/MRDRNA2_30388_c0_seq1:170-2164(-)